MDDDKRFYGKYRGTVLDNVDPEQRGRLMVQVADVGGVLPSSWALPCLPFAGPQHGFFAVPPPHAPVWVEFEHGDPSYPIWTGCFWDTPATVPPLALAGAPGVQQVVVQTIGQAMLLLSDTPGPPAASCSAPRPRCCRSPAPGSSSTTARARRSAWSATRSRSTGPRWW